MLGPALGCPHVDTLRLPPRGHSRRPVVEVADQRAGCLLRQSQRGSEFMHTGGSHAEAGNPPSHSGHTCGLAALT